MQVTLDWGNILVMVLAGVVGFVWNTLQSQFRSAMHSLKTELEAEIRTLRDRTDRNDTSLSLIPRQFEKVSEQLQRIELSLSRDHPNKEEFKALESSVARLTEQMARVSGPDDPEPTRSTKRR